MPPLFSMPFNLATNTDTMASSSRQQLSPYTATIELVSNTSLDRRVITLSTDKRSHIGRASRSEVKNLQPADDNALYDCPVVSRHHAELRVSPMRPRGEQVIITDLDSLHGTTVNGRRIAPGEDFTLKSGDVVKLGERVTRGDDTHDGISLTYHLLDDTIARDQYRPSYQMPSEAEASDFESDVESIHSFAQEESSAHTTPESSKLGSQDQPILIGDSLAAPVIDLSQEEREMAPEKDLIPDTYEEDNEPVAAEEDDVDEGAHTGSEDERSFYQSDDDDYRFDESGDIDGENDDDENGDGDDDDQDFPPADDLADSHGHDFSFNTGSQRLSAGIKEKLAELRPANPSITAEKPQPVSESFAPKARYDPVRNSQPPPENEATDSTAAHAAAPASTTTNPKKTYTSRWDMKPRSQPAFYPADGINMGNFMPKPDPTPPSLFDNYYSPQPFAPFFEPLASPGGWNAGSAPFVPLNDVPVPEETAAAPAQPHIPAPVSGAIAASSNKISIPNIIENNDAAPKDIQLAQVPSPGINKRKADEMEADANEAATSDPAAAVLITAPRSKKRRIHRHGAVRKVITDMAKYGTAAVFGAAATVAFLSSPAAQSLIDYLG